MNTDFETKAREILERQGVRSIAQRQAAERGLAGPEAEKYVTDTFEICVEGLAMDLQQKAEGEASAITRRIMEV